MDMTAIQISVAKLEAKAGDTLMFTSDRQMTGEQLLAFRDQIDALIPPGVKAMLLSGGLNLEVISADPRGAVKV